MLRHRAVRHCLCPVPSQQIRSRAEWWGWPKREDGEKSFATTSFLIQTPSWQHLLLDEQGLCLGVCAMVGVSAIWLSLFLVLPLAFLVSAMPGCGAKQLAANFFKLAGKLLLQTSVPCPFPYL